MNGKSLLIGIVTGAVISGITTLLTTPKSGQEAKQLLKNNYEQINKIMLKGKKETLAIKNQMTKTAEISSNALKSVTVELKDSLDIWRKDVEPTLKQLNHEIDELQKTLKNHTK